MSIATITRAKLPTDCSEEERRVRTDLAAAYRLVAHFGWDDLIFTHLSARVPGPEQHFLINPYGLLFSEITASSLVKVDLQGQVVDGSEARVNPAGFTIHSAIHAARSDAHCVMHLHTIAGTAVASTSTGLLPCNQTAMLLNGKIAYHDFEGLANDLDERPRLVADLGDKPAMILRNHGTLTVGPSVAEAFLTLYFLERACAMQVAMNGAAPRHLPGSSVQERVEVQAGAVGMPFISKELVWPALIRMLDAHQPDFRH